MNLKKREAEAEALLKSTASKTLVTMEFIITSKNTENGSKFYCNFHIIKRNAQQALLAPLCRAIGAFSFRQIPKLTPQAKRRALSCD